MRRLSSITFLNVRRSLFRSSTSHHHQQPFDFASLSLKPFFFTLQNHLYHNHSSILLHNSLSSQPHYSDFSSVTLRCFSTSGSSQDSQSDEYETEEIEEWEEEDDAEPEIDDGGSGGGIVLQNVPWGEQVLSIAHEVLLHFGDDIKLFSFKTTPRGYIYVRLDKLSNEYGCPSMEEIESYSRQYKKRLEEEGSKGQIPEDLALEVSSPGAERLLKVPDDLHRFKDFPMVVSYVEGGTEEAKSQEKTGIFHLDSVETESEHCVWKLANVRENRDPASKGKPLNRKQKDWRLKLPYSTLKKVMLYLES